MKKCKSLGKKILTMPKTDKELVSRISKKF